jgi:hypothetical protein
VADNYATTKKPGQGLAATQPADQLHFTPTSGSWMNLVFFGIITRLAIRRGTFTSVKELTNDIEIFIDGWNERCERFKWTKTADQILAKAKPRQRDFKHATLAARFGLPKKAVAH